MLTFAILIPTKNYKIGLIRILKSLPKRNRIKLIIIISDDSDNYEIQDYIKNINYPNLIYKRNFKQKGLNDNWNSLLTNLNDYDTDYFMFLHNDDFINDIFFFDKLEKLIKTHQYPDIINVDTKIIDLKKKKARWHFNHLLRFIMFYLSKKYILKRNFVGPVSSLIIKNNNKTIRFDKKLRWLVDVDFYYRLFKDKKVIFTNELYVVSEYNNKFSQHYLLSKNYKKIKKKEMKQLIKKYKFTFKEKIIFGFDIFILLFSRSLNFILNSSR